MASQTGGGKGTTRDIHGVVHIKGASRAKPAAPAPTSGVDLVQQAAIIPIDRPPRPATLPDGITLQDGVLRIPSNSGSGSYDVRVYAVGDLIQTSCSCPASRYGKGKLCKHSQQALDIMSQHDLVDHSRAGWHLTERGRQMGDALS